MRKNERIRGGRELAIFCFGFGSCLLVVCLVVAWLCWRGVSVSFDAGALCDNMAEQIEVGARARIPLMVDEAKKQIPAMVAARMVNSLGCASIQIGEFTVSFPEEGIRRFEAVLQEIVESAMLDLLDQTDTEAWARQLGEDARAALKEVLVATLGEVRPRVKLFRGLAIPVMVRAE